MTEQGKARLQLARQYYLGGYYQENVGNLILDEEALTLPATREAVLKFLHDNEDWVLGYETNAYNEGYWHITHKDEL